MCIFIISSISREKKRMHYFIGLEYWLLKVSPTTHRHKRQHSPISNKILITRKRNWKTNQSQRLDSGISSTLNYYHLNKWPKHIHAKMRKNSRVCMNKISHPFLVLSQSYRLRFGNLLTIPHFIFYFLCAFICTMCLFCFFKIWVIVSLYLCRHIFWLTSI